MCNPTSANLVTVTFTHVSDINSNASVMSKNCLKHYNKVDLCIISSFDRDCLWPHSQGLPSCIL